MKFAKWLAEMEQQTMNFPPAQRYYLACVLDVSDSYDPSNPVKKHGSKDLIRLAEQEYFSKTGIPIPANWHRKAHHMTVKFNCSQMDFQKFEHLFGKTVEIKVTSLSWNDMIMAANVVTNPAVPSDNPHPHITIAHSPNVRPIESNKMLSATRPQVNVNLELLSTFLAVNKQLQTDYWPPRT